MCLFHFSTCFEQLSAHHQENQLYQYIIWYISLCVGGRLVCRSLDALFTCFEQLSAHHQENQLYQYIIWYISLCVGGRLVCRSLDALFNVFVSLHYIFQATQCSSSGEWIVSIHHLVYITLCRWPSGMQVSDLHTRRPPTPIYQMMCWYNWFSWWWALSCSKHVKSASRDLHTRRPPTQSDIYQMMYWYNDSPDDEHWVARNM